MNPAVDPTDALQVGVYALLSSDTELDGLVTGVYDGAAREGAELDYVVIGAMTSSREGSHGGEGRQTLAMLHTWTRSEGFKSANDIGARLVALLWHRHAELDAQVDGHTVWRVEHEFSQTMVDAQPGIRHRVDHFRIWTSQEA